jgi:hypothetical protein
VGTSSASSFDAQSAVQQKPQSPAGEVHHSKAPSNMGWSAEPAASLTPPGVTRLSPSASPITPEAGAKYQVPMMTGEVIRQMAQLTISPEVAKHCQENGLKLDLIRAEVTGGGKPPQSLVAGADKYKADFAAKYPGWPAPNWSSPNEEGMAMEPAGKMNLVMWEGKPMVQPERFAWTAHLTSQPAPGAHPAAEMELSAQEHGEYKQALKNFLPDLKAGLSGEMTVRNQFDMSIPKGKIPTAAQVEAICQKLANDPSIPHAYIHDGCHGRAHLFAEEMQKQGFNVEKLFVHGELSASNQFTMNQTWGYHVAPLTMMRDHDGEVKPMVIDLSFKRSGAMEPAEWVNRFNQKKPVEVETARRDQLYPPSLASHTTASFEDNVSEAKERLKPFNEALTQMRKAFEENAVM